MREADEKAYMKKGGFSCESRLLRCGTGWGSLDTADVLADGAARNLVRAELHRIAMR